MVSLPKISPNLLLGVGGVIAAVFLVSQIRKAGADLTGALTDIKLPDVVLPEIKFPALPTVDTTGLGIFLSSITDIFKAQQDTLSQLAGQTIVQPDGSTITIPADTTIDPITGIVTSSTPPLLDLSDAEKQKALEALALGIEKSKLEQALADIPVSEDISGAEFASAINEAAFIKAQQDKLLQEAIPVAPTPTPEVISLLPEPQQFEVFAAEGSQATQFTIFENPIDTLSEAIALGLTASQAADFLAATGGKITPSQIASGEIDPEIKNIVAGFVGGGVGQAVPVSATPLETLSIKESEALKAAKFTCEQFGLNCELVDSMMA